MVNNSLVLFVSSRVSQEGLDVISSENTCHRQTDTHTHTRAHARPRVFPQQTAQYLVLTFPDFSATKRSYRELQYGRKYAPR